MSIFESLNQPPKKKVEKPTFLPTFHTIEDNISTILTNIQNNVYSDIKIQELILDNYENFLNYENFRNPKTRKVFQLIWSHPKFLRNFLAVLNNSQWKSLLNYIRNTHMISMNTIAYDYYSSHISDQSANETIDLLFKICDIVDYKYIVALEDIMDHTTARSMTIANFSSDNAEISINRFNFLIIWSGYDFTIKNIIYIYSKFYLNDFSTLFNTTMVSTIFNPDTVQDTSPERANLNNIAMHNSDRIGYALLSILESMTMDHIRDILMKYHYYLQLSNKNTVRFSMHDISGEFERINAVVNSLEADGYMIR